ncbi:Fe-S protein assembly co-chaperone HscB [Telmatobacter bradus]|uniref:Fe-S protein assembly co-chaperone HscB n=1 Tax=Telmatobacter bradus TaxID=474953 RepID=UPI003B4378FB
MLNVLNNAVPVACWSCSISHVESTLFCPHCSKIQPPPGGDYFSVFGIAPKLNLDLNTLEQEFHRLSRRLHPDRYARALENEREWSLADTALVNDAYRTLKDPLRRTEYLLKLSGSAIGEEHSGRDRKDPSRVPADLLEEAFDLNMQLEEMRMARKAGAKDADLEAQLQDAKKKFTTLLAEVDSDLRTQWSVWEAGNDEVRKQSQKTMVALLDRRRYLSNLVRDVNEVLGA